MSVLWPSASRDLLEFAKFRAGRESNLGRCFESSGPGHVEEVKKPWQSGYFPGSWFSLRGATASNVPTHSGHDIIPSKSEDARIALICFNQCPGGAAPTRHRRSKFRFCSMTISSPHLSGCLCIILQLWLFCRVRSTTRKCASPTLANLEHSTPVAEVTHRNGQARSPRPSLVSLVTGFVGSPSR